MKSKELALFGIQSNCIAAEIKENTVNIQLAQGKLLVITCPSDKDARDVYNTIMFYPVNNNDNNCCVMNFEMSFEII